MDIIKKRPNSSHINKIFVEKNNKSIKKEITQNDKNDSKKTKKNPKSPILNTNLSITIKNFTTENTLKKIKYKNIPESIINNPKKYTDLINDNCFHLEMNLKLLGFQENFLKLCN